LGLPQAMGKDLQNINPSAVRMPGYGFYARDQWQVNRKLTLNIGFRLERYPFAKRDHRGGERYDPVTDVVLIGGLGGVPEDTGVSVPAIQFAPRFGIAYRVTERTVVRAGYGISIDPDNYRRMRDSYPAVISQQIGGATAFQAAGDLRTGLPPIIGPDVSSGRIELPRTVGTLTWPENYRRGYFQSFNFTIQSDIGLGFNFQTAYVGTRGIRQTAVHNINYGVPGSGNNGRVLARQFGRVANIDMYMPFNTTNYNGWQNQLTRRFADGGVFGLVYTWSKAINYADNNDSGLTWNWPELWDRNRATAGFDRTHNLQIYGVYTLPFGKGKRYLNSGIASKIAGGWQLNGVFSKMTGLPFTVESAGTSVDAPGNQQTADQVKPEVKTLGRVGRGESWFDPDAFAPVTAVRFGNSGRNILRGPGLTNLDASMFRDFPITERWKLQFRAEAFNVSNTPSFNLPGRTVSTLQRNTDGSIRALNNYTEITSALNTERQFRFALKLMF
ncbi:MAG TPA: TonB-dependent receptor, partial [Bryobacteraceae bacterium]|nr:TonB-dependent receptor [Bryobacteraceae bacterium]